MTTSSDGGAAPVVLFDLDDTLMAHREAVALGIAEHVRHRAYRTDDEAELARRWHELEERHYAAYLAGALSYEEQRRARATAFAGAFGEHLDDDAASSWFSEYFERYRGAWAIHDDVLPALDVIAEALPAVRYGIITNGELEVQTSKLVRLALEGRIEHVIASGALGVAKPDPAIFDAALERFSRTAAVSSAAYVGDRLRTDAIGAARAGLIGVWVNRHDDPLSPDDDAEATALGVVRIRSLAELPDALIPRLSD